MSGESEGEEVSEGMEAHAMDGMIGDCERRVVNLIKGSVDSGWRMRVGMEKGISLVVSGASRGGRELRIRAVTSCWRRKGMSFWVKAGRRPCSM